jgi:hypothetical protein
MSILNHVFQELVHEQKSLIKYDKSFEIVKNKQSFSESVKESLFKIIFNQKLFAYLSFRIQKITKPPSQVDSTASLSVFGVTMNNVKDPYLNLKWNDEV